MFFELNATSQNTYNNKPSLPPLRCYGHLVFAALALLLARSLLFSVTLPVVSQVDARFLQLCLCCSTAYLELFEALVNIFASLFCLFKSFVVVGWAPKTITGVKIGVNAHFKGFRPQGEAPLALLVGSLSVTLSVGRESGGLLRGAAGGP